MQNYNRFFFLQVSELDTAKENLQNSETRAILSEEIITSMNRDKGCNDELKSYYESQMKEVQQWCDRAVAGLSDGVFTVRHLTICSNIMHVIFISFPIH